jgi:hypothetical protein
MIMGYLLAVNLPDAERLALHHRPLGLSGGSGSTMRRLLAGLDERCDRRLDRARARVRSRVWALLHAAEQGFPWITLAGKTITGWVVVDMDATIITCATRKESAAGTFKGTWGHHPLAAWYANTMECLARTLRPGNAHTNHTRPPHRVHRRARAAPGLRSPADPGPHRRGGKPPSRT